MCDVTLACEVSTDITHKFASDLSMIDSRCPIALSYISLLNLTKGKQLDELRSQIFTNIFINSNKNLRFYYLLISLSFFQLLYLFSPQSEWIFFLSFSYVFSSYFYLELCFISLQTLIIPRSMRTRRVENSFGIFWR